MKCLKQLVSKNVVAHLEEMAQDERTNQIEILRGLSELDERHVVVEMGYSGLWDFCRRRLKFSEATSTRRVNVARASRRYPDLLTMLEDGRLNLGTASDLSQVLADDNCAEVLAAAAGKTAREVQRLVDPSNAKTGTKRDVIRRMACQTAAAAISPLAIVEHTSDAQFVPVAPAAFANKVAEIVLHRVSFTADEQVVAKLERLQEILGGATLAEVCDRAADLLLDKVDKVRRVAKRQQKAKVKAAPARKQVAPKIPRVEPRRPGVALSDQVFAESGMRCTFVSEDGVLCAETRYLTIDHVRPYALGGRSTDPANLRCYCSAHNLHAGRKSFGPYIVQTERKN